MPRCDAHHRAYDKIANSSVQVGELPEGMHIRGKVAWFVYAGPYRDISEKGWGEFMKKMRAADLTPRGSPGDVYICDPMEHPADGQAKMLTILWAPL